MNNIKIFLIFLVMFLLMIPISFLFYNSDNKKILDNYTTSILRDTCANSPENVYFQECFRKDLARIMSSYTPQDTLGIISSLHSLYQMDRSYGETKNDMSYVDLLYFENWIIAIENSGNLSIARNDFSFFDIAIIPYAKLVFKNDVKKVLEKFKTHDQVFQNNEYNKHKSRWMRVKTKLSSLKL